MLFVQIWVQDFGLLVRALLVSVNALNNNGIGPNLISAESKVPRDMLGPIIVSLTLGVRDCSIVVFVYDGRKLRNTYYSSSLERTLPEEHDGKLTGSKPAGT